MNKNPNHEFDHTKNENRRDKEKIAKDPDWDRGLLDEFEPFGKREKGEPNQKAVREEPKNTDPHGLLDEFEPFGKKEKVFSDEERDREIAQENYTPDADIEEKVEEARIKAEKNDIGEETPSQNTGIKRKRNDQNEGYEADVNLPGSQSLSRKAEKDKPSPNRLGEEFEKKYEEKYVKETPQKKQPAEEPLGVEFEEKYREKYADKNASARDAEEDHRGNKDINTAIPNAGFEEKYREKYVNKETGETGDDLYTDPEAKENIKDRGELREENVVEEALRETKARQREEEKGEFLKEELERLELEGKQYGNNIYKKDE